jgi:NifU-like protein
MAWQYSEKTLQLFMNAVHHGKGSHLGEISDPDGVGEHGSLICGDMLRFSFRVRKDPDNPLQDLITEARYLTFGCTSAIAASEALCLIIEHRHCTPVDALKISNQDIVDFLEGLPEQKIHCSVMGAEALEAAVFDWAEKRGVDLAQFGYHPHETDQDEGRLVCKCFSLSEPYIRRHIREMNLHTIPEITNAIKAGGACKSCHYAPGGLQDLLDEIWGAPGTRPASNAGVEEDEQDLSPYRLAKKIEECLNRDIKPQLQKDGGDIELVDIKGKLVYCTLSGACQGCPAAATTLKLMVEKTLKDLVDERLHVIAL